ncbi:pullulanase-type alpha-1,6-glucosidase [Exilibacterium tricleocarpae]|uniref:Pullulanase-type alpha-1,6-glucosidase n=1 Tax=Exilibacterium tricleocarpae TaxID=2591008 RepID=A0A545TVC3_9GAMM|nr:pullulanase-type alpha-1,6-glucosidase [Exilibacterium tricleocarpae]TQV81167.1 pullulanase-type alpha-1,6-glucosidase [Exilibacterium tricleocarpae]
MMVAESVGRLVTRVLGLCILTVGLTACDDRTADIKDDVVYFVLPDRFANGSTANDTGNLSGTRDDHGLDATDKAYYHGGDLLGLKRKLPYLKEMGVTAIWMTPIFENLPTSGESAAYHGYWAVDYTRVDPHLGTEAELRRLIQRAHKLGIKVFFDIVINHTADVIQYEQCQGGADCPYRPTSEQPYTPFVPAGLEQIKQPEWLNDTALYNNRGNSTFSGESSLLGDFFGLDDLNTQDPVVVAGMIDIFKYWISEYAIDGFRLDTVKHVDVAFWQQWTPAILEHAAAEGIDNFHIFGEIFDGDPRGVSRFTTEAKLPSALDFGLYFALKDVFADNVAPARLAAMFDNDDWYSDADSDASTLMTFASNHDIGRLGRAIKDANPDAADEEYLKRLQLAYGLMYFGRGVPVIYYGDEQGFVGDGGDKDAREDMMPSLVASYNDNNLIGTDSTTADANFDRRHPMYRMFKRYKKVLDRHRTLRRGDQYLRHADTEPGILALSRVDRDNPREYLVVMNTATEARSVTLGATSDSYRQVFPRGGRLRADADDTITLEVPPLSLAIYKARQSLAAASPDAISLGLVDGGKVRGRFEVPADVSWPEANPLPLTAVDFEVSVDGGDFVAAGRDPAADYRIFFNADAYADGTQLTFRASTTDLAGNTLSADPVTVEVGAVAGMTVYFQKPADWGDNINIYYWNADPAPPVEWPGIAIESLGADWYSYQFPDGVRQANIIFNDGQNQTADLFRDRDGCFVDGAWTDTCNLPQPGLEFFFKKPASWGDNINIYYWNADPAPAVDWPGIRMEALPGGWYRFRMPAAVDSANIIFNDGEGNQTPDLFRDAGGCYGDNGDNWTDTCELPTAVTISGARAHWVDSGTLAWQTASAQAATFKLYASATAAIAIDGDTLSGADQILDLTPGALLSDAVTAKFRHLADWPAYALSADTATVATALRAQLVAAAFDSESRLLEATKVQIPGVVDELYTYAGQLGPVLANGGLTLSLWAPTAQSVMLKRYDAAFNLIATSPPSDVSNGRYSFSGNLGWLDQYYRYEITVYHPASGRIEIFEVTDPYSVGLSQDSRFSQIVDLAGDATLKPAGWDALVKSLPAHKDITLYEGHVRDFSAHDQVVAPEHRGKYLAFVYNGLNGMPRSDGMAHLQALQQAGLTHFHVLPVNDLGSIRENPADRVELDDPYSRLCEKTNVIAIEEGCAQYGDTPIRQVYEQLRAADPLNTDIQAINYDDRTLGFPAVDSFNWGYDPFHFLAPEGSYASDANGKVRIREFRQMVKALHEIGLNVVVDVVFNHTFASGLGEKSVLDKVVPGYYHRLNPLTGTVENSTCCDNTAAEHAMMEKLMIDAVKLWAQHYKVDAFRFDLMGHHPKTSLQNIQAALAGLTPAEHGVQGDRIYLYGEGWDFGEVSGNQRFEQATQFNMAGTGVGTFNDRLRDAVRGGNFTDRGRAQGFANGNATYPNGVADGAGSVGDQGDRIRIGLAGNLQTYTFEDNGGGISNGLGYSGVGYNLDPQENILYVDKHDNETLWDNTQAKLPDALDMDARVRVHALSQAFVNLAQGVPFHQMGSDLLRSKSMDRDSFDSGDWFNKVDFSKQDNNWAVGLPSQDKNGERWPVMRQIMGNANIDPQPQHIELAATLFREQLALRYSTPLFRLDAAADVEQRLGFWNTGADQVPGVVVMSVSDGQCAGADLDANLDGLVVVFNTDDETVSMTVDALAGTAMGLHAIQQAGVDDVVKGAGFDTGTGTFSVPARTAAVFVADQAGGQGEFPCNDKNGLIVEPGFTVYFQKPAAWAEVSVYYWNTTPATPDVAWPGIAMEAIGNDWYTFTFPDGVTAANLIFNNNGAGEQTADLFREGDGCFDYNTAIWSDTCDLPGLQFWFRKPANWSDDVQFYFWGASVPGPAWPGLPMENRGDGWFFFQMPDGVRQTNLIFNDAASGTGEQTSDLSRSASGCYSFDRGWEDSCAHP